VLVWINGQFGGGKTATAFELQRRLPGSVVCDPEHAGFGLRREHWAVSRLDDCLARLREPEFAEHIHTDQQTVPLVADEIARSAGLPISPDTDGPLRGSLRRYATTLRHVRRD